MKIEPLLNEQTPAVGKVYDTCNIAETCKELLGFAIDNPHMKLAGLAANQVAIDGIRCGLNVCFVRVGEIEWITAINPEIISTFGGTFNATEGCLTWPNKQIRAIRSAYLTVRYQRVDGSSVTRDAKDFEAQVWQHEVNHLRGIAENVIDPEVLSDLKPNDKCSCGSGKKFKKCCGR